MNMLRKGFLYQFCCQSNYQNTEIKESIPTYYLLANQIDLFCVNVFFYSHGKLLKYSCQTEKWKRLADYLHKSCSDTERKNLVECTNIFWHTPCVVDAWQCNRYICTKEHGVNMITICRTKKQKCVSLYSNNMIDLELILLSVGY